MSNLFLPLQTSLFSSVTAEFPTEKCSGIFKSWSMFQADAKVAPCPASLIERRGLGVLVELKISQCTIQTHKTQKRRVVWLQGTKSWWNTFCWAHQTLSFIKIKTKHHQKCAFTQNCIRKLLAKTHRLPVCWHLYHLQPLQCPSATTSLIEIVLLTFRIL